MTALRILLLALAVMLPLRLLAQEAAILVADEVQVTRDRLLVARGNVEVFQGDVSLTARSITYDQSTGALVIEGPLRLRDGDDILVLASAAELDTELRAGILRSARMVIDQQLQLAAVQINRVDARYSQLYKTAVTACRICNDGRPPLWQIRAKRVVHDKEERQLYFDNAQFRVGNVPILYLPRLRLPDPTLDRATGFLIPSIRTTSALGTGIVIPYFIRIGDHKDLTLTPYLSAETRTLEFRYRQAFRTGRIDLTGAASQDSLSDTTSRYYVFGSGTFGLRQGFRLDFDIEAVSDDSYLNQYAYSFKDRLDSAVSISRARRDQYVQGGVILYDSLRDGEIQSQLPTVVIDGSFEQRFFPRALGGELRVGLAGHAHYRSSTSTVPGEGRDVARINGDLFWLRNWTLFGGLVADTRLGVAFDAFQTQEDAVFAGTEQQIFPQGSVALRYPLTKTTQTGTVHFLEPVVQLAWTGGSQIDVANDESTQVEFDEGNLLALSRFPEVDRREHGRVIAYGINWARYDPDGLESYLTLGQIVRDDAIADFSATSGLDNTRSDYLIAGQLRTQDGLAFAGRALFDNSMDFTKAEFRADWSSGRATMGGSYLWITDDPAVNRPDDVSELTFVGSYRVNPHWAVSADWRYDLADDRLARAGLGLGYDNECVTVDLSVQRRFAQSATVEPVTDFSFTIGLRGFSAQVGTESYTRSCKSNAS